MDTDLMMWEGFSGKAYEFWVFGLKKKFGRFGAVFIYAQQNAKTGFDMMYINLTDRMDFVASNRIAEFVQQEYAPDCLHILKCDDIADRKRVMSDLIVRHNPPGNRMS